MERLNAIRRGSGPSPVIVRLIMLGVFIAALSVFMTASAAGADQPDPQVSVPDDAIHELNQFGFDKVTPDAVRLAAETDLELFLQSIPVHDLQHYGFPPGGDFQGITLGEPYRVMTIHPQSLFDSAGDEDIRTLLTPTSMWFFPILQRGEPRAILTVDLMDGRWQAVAIGSSGLAAQLHRMEQEWSADKGFERILVRIFQATSDVMLVVSDDLVQAVPFESAVISLKLDDIRQPATQPHSTAEIITRLIPVVRDNLNRNSE